MVDDPLARRFEAVIFDWDGTAVPDRGADATGVRERVESLCALGMDVAVVSGTHVGNVDGQLGARPSGPGRLHLLLNRGSEAFRVDATGPVLLERREATDRENAALTEAAERTVAELARRGVAAAIVSERLNRRKIDLIPLEEWEDPPKARIGELLTAVDELLARAGVGGLREAVEIAQAAAAEAGLPHPRVTSDVKHVEIGLTDKADSARWILADLWRRGVGPRAALVAGDELGSLGGLAGSDSLLLVPEASGVTAVSVGVEPEGVPDGVIPLGGGPAAFAALLDGQLERRRAGTPPEVVPESGWSLVVDGIDPDLERAHEALLTLADGRIGTSGVPVLAYPAARPAVVAAGVYTGHGPETELAVAPAWDVLVAALTSGDRLRRVLDLRTGLLGQEAETAAGSARAVLFSSLARPGTVAMRAEGPPAILGPEKRRTTKTAERDDGLAGVLRDVSRRRGALATLERLGVYSARDDGGDAAGEARLAGVEEAGYERLLAEHREAWAGRWENADVAVDGDPGLQLALRLALFHLIGSAASDGEAAVGARGLTGTGYRGHVFWDADVFVLPFLAATHPPAARAILEYRIRRLAAAREAATAAGRAGARFPWESARSGRDVTPTSARDLAGRVVSILTGKQEEHITADVAWAAACYVDWTGDEEFEAGPGTTLLVETARYWASRLRMDEEGRGHIDGVIGPDEYHEGVDDNAFTNVMARWNLRRAVDAVRRRDGVDEAEVEGWARAADALVDGYSSERGIYEQFAGFFALEPLVIADAAPRRPIDAAALLGYERLAGAQVVKQADVLMLHHLIPDEVVPGSLEANLDFYEPRTAHGSSLSPGVHASLLARAGRSEQAVAAARLAGRIDLEDLTGTTAGGVHLATMGSLWQAFAWGFLGLRPRGATLSVDPRLPPGWRSLAINVRFRGSRVRLRVEGEELEVTADSPVELRIGASDQVLRAGPEGLRVRVPATR